MQLREDPIIPNQQQVNQQGQNVVPPKPKKQKQSVALKPEHFQKANGLRKLYEMTKELDLERADINVENTMKKIVLTLKKWQFEMYPKYQFDYFLQRSQVLGGDKLLSAYMAKVRRIHKGQESWEQFEERKEDQPNQEIGSEKHSQINQEFRQSLNILGQDPNINHANHPSSEGEDDEDFMQLMMKMEKKKDQKEGKQQHQEFNEPYIPEGFEQEYGDQSDEERN